MCYLSLVIVILFWSNDFAFGISKANKGANDGYTVPLHIYQFKYRLDNTNNDKTKHLTQSYQHEQEPTLLNDIFAVILLSTLFVIIWLLSAIKCSLSNTTLIYCVIISINTNIAHSSNHYGIWRTNGPLPRSVQQAAVAYDNTNHTIYLIGGVYVRRQLTSIKNNNIFNDYGTSELAADIYGNGQHWTQIGDILWTVEGDGNYFVTFNVKTLSVQTQPQTPSIPNNADDGCLTSIVAQQHIYLIVISGVTVQIYDHTSGEWLSNIPSMQTARTRFPCLVHNNMLYAIGGNFIDSIEVLNVDNLENLFNWYFIDNLLTSLHGHRAVIYDDDILVLGGQIGSLYGDYNAQINVINTLTNTVTSGGFLNYGSRYAAAIVVYPIIYHFSGYDGNDVYTWQINTDVKICTHTPDPTTSPSNIPSIAPTSTPSLSPSLSPTMAPSQKPTSNPSNAPSNAPSSTPSFPPSIAPSSTPTYVPFASPSNFPTLAPSQFPTTNPTDAPTKSPTFQPTAMPTFIPSLTPTTNETEESISKMAGEHSENSYLFIIGTVVLVLVLFIVICIMCLVMVKLKKKSDLAQEQQHSDGYDQIELSLGNINAMNVDVRHEQRRTDKLVANDDDDGQGRDSNYEQIRNGSDKSDSEQLFVPILQNDETKNEIEMQINNNLNEDNKTNPFKTWFEEKINIPNSKNIYYQLFVDNGYETVEIVQFLTRNKLKNMGITKAGHIDKIMMEIEDLKKRSEVEGNAVSEGIDGSKIKTD